MERPKFKPVLQEAVVQERRTEEEQAQLQKKYNLPAKKHIEIRKEHLLTSLIKAIGKMIRLIACSVLLFLAFVGTIAILYPEARIVLFGIYADAMGQLKDFMPIIN